jgi:hypothetical protein
MAGEQRDELLANGAGRSEDADINSRTRGTPFFPPREGAILH